MKKTKKVSPAYYKNGTDMLNKLKVGTYQLIKTEKEVIITRN
mgnify:CR=1 FL=1